MVFLPSVSLPFPLLFHQFYFLLPPSVSPNLTFCLIFPSSPLSSLVSSCSSIQALISLSLSHVLFSQVRLRCPISCPCWQRWQWQPSWSRALWLSSRLQAATARWALVFMIHLLKHEYRRATCTNTHMLRCVLDSGLSGQEAGVHIKF